MNISHISVSTLPVLYRFGGAIERRIVEIAHEQARRGHRVSVYSVGDSTDTREVNGVTYHFLKCRTRLPFRHLEFQYQGRARAEEALRRGAALPQPAGRRVDEQGGGGQEGALVRLLPLPRRPRDATLSPVQARAPRLRPAPALLAVLPGGVADLLELSGDKLRILYNGVNTQQFRPDPEAAARERRQLGIDKKVMLYVGRVCEQKGSDVLLQTAKTLSERRRDVQLVIAGPIGQFGLKDDPNRWVERIRQVGGLYLGAVEESRLNAIYNLADVFVMPTRALRDVRHGRRRGAGVRQAGRLQRLGRPEGGGPVELRRALPGRRFGQDGGRDREAGGRLRTSMRPVPRTR